jgi:hypothetical protein
MKFFVGLHQPHAAQNVTHPAFISINRIRDRRSAFVVGDWIMDSGAFSTIGKYGRYPDAPEVYAAQIKRWSTNGNLLAAVSQDYMCEAHMLELTGMTVADHQRLTIERYDALRAADTGGVYIMPVLQGYEPADYVSHLTQYGDRLAHGAWVGVGSVCKRNTNIGSIESVLGAIKAVRPDLRLHGFGIKTTALTSAAVRDWLYTADSMAWSFAARKQGRNGNDWREAQRFADHIVRMPIQERMIFA